MFCLFSCKKSSTIHYDSTSQNSIEEIYDDEDTDDSEITDGIYCAEIEYYNPNTGSSNTYNLDVEVEYGDLVKIYWPNRGWLDSSHFTPTDITSGSCFFVNDKGYEYNVTLEEKGGCY